MELLQSAGRSVHGTASWLWRRTTELDLSLTWSEAADRLEWHFLWVYEIGFTPSDVNVTQIEDDGLPKQNDKLRYLLETYMYRMLLYQHGQIYSLLYQLSQSTTQTQVWSNCCQTHSSLSEEKKRLSYGMDSVISDSDYTGDLEDRHFIFRYVFIINNKAIRWYNAKQKVIPLVQYSQNTWL